MHVSGRPCTGDDGGWQVMDVPATHHRVAVYGERVLGKFWEVLHCLLEEGRQRDDAGDGRGRNGFYSLGEAPLVCRDACKWKSLMESPPVDNLIDDNIITTLVSKHNLVAVYRDPVLAMF